MYNSFFVYTSAKFAPPLPRIKQYVETVERFRERVGGWAGGRAGEQRVGGGYEGVRFVLRVWFLFASYQNGTISYNLGV
jgi:hypothetical protein